MHYFLNRVWKPTESTKICPGVGRKGVPLVLVRNGRDGTESERLV